MEGDSLPPVNVRGWKSVPPKIAFGVRSEQNESGFRRRPGQEAYLSSCVPDLLREGERVFSSVPFFQEVVMSSMVKLFKELFGPWTGRMPPCRKPRFARQRLEELEERWCPADVWTWSSGMDTSWGNMVGTNWLKNGNAVNPGDYPGKPGQQGDIVVFNNLFAANCTLDVPTVSLGELDLVGTYFGTLTLTFPLSVSGASGDFRLTDGAAIAMTGSSSLTLSDLGPQTGVIPNL
jgi:hypothetical protein